ncbi:transposase IS4 family protein [Chthoniobacter flavus Ellin428]|uniref:Transposase IS4 family protein n=1 Tax=Chthoniobacter flavus Ellin428 TaxID=497964 RepID=B4CV80_9BACT|nr:IS5/IS1182 family transposase [Chthoniobacter flavus]EDY22468.1 transposase IS4 family protein [Chthoniobacter flavus Ellin428]TCO82126.1 transposase [Chthoniobacter flavus]
MAARFVNIDHDTPLLLPPDLRDWVRENHLVHFVMDAIGLLDLGEARVNHRGTGDEQYPPAMMLGLLIYCYATGTFSSRKIEGLTHENVAVRYLCADTHPDHDSICEFRRGNRALLESSFHQVLECAARAKVLQVGDITVALDGTKILASASKHSAVSHGHAVAQMQLLEEQIAQLLAKAESADSAPLQDGLSIPEEVSRRQDRLAKLKEAVAVIEERAQARRQEELAAYRAKVQEREAKAKRSGKKPRGRDPKPPPEGPDAQDQYNFTDPESRVMKAGSGQHFEQSYNAQTAVEVDSRLIIAQHVTNAPNDKQQLVPTVAAISPVVTTIASVLVDSGFYSAAAVAAVEAPEGERSGPKVYAATGRQQHGRTIAQLEKRDDPSPPAAAAPPVEHMAHRVQTQAGRALYALRKQTIEPVFGIIKEALGFRRFRLRGLAKVNLEWTLVSLSYNLKRLYHLGTDLQTT